MTNDMRADDVRLRIMRARLHYGSQKALAEKAGISEQYLSDAINGRRDWPQRLLEFVGVERYTAYQDLGMPEWMKRK